MRLATALLAASLTVLAWPATAQNNPIRSFPIGGDVPRHPQMITVGFRFSVPGDTGSAEKQGALAEEGRRAVYMLMSKECQILLATIATTCRLKHANVHTSTRPGRGDMKGTVDIHGNASYEVELKPVER
ncbi:MAG: hypothetical protein KDJ41_20885 [Hyphomicrobiaceae bacterium]|nr:hypothetical protein [Hyphomicrobiaceae bacterium]